MPCAYQFILHCIDVLKFIYQQIVKTLAADGIQLKPFGQQVVKIQHTPLLKLSAVRSIQRFVQFGRFKGSAVFYTGNGLKQAACGLSAFHLCQHICRNGKRFASAD